MLLLMKYGADWKKVKKVSSQAIRLYNKMKITVIILNLSSVSVIPRIGKRSGLRHLPIDVLMLVKLYLWES